MTVNGLKILVVDDDERIGKLFRDVFSGEGHAVKAVLTGEEAVTVYQKNPYQLVFLDMILPGISGLETLRALKKLDTNVHVVLMTGYSVLGMLEDAGKIGIITTLIKPFHIDQIRQAIEQSVVASNTAVGVKKYSTLIIDEWLNLSKKLERVFKELDFDVQMTKSVADMPEEFKEREFDLILISTSALEKNTMQTFYYMKETMPTSKCIMLIDEHMDIHEISANIKEMFYET